MGRPAGRPHDEATSGVAATCWSPSGDYNSRSRQTGNHSGSRAHGLHADADPASGEGRVAMAGRAAVGVVAARVRQRIALVWGAERDAAPRARGSGGQVVAREIDGGGRALAAQLLCQQVPSACPPGSAWQAVSEWLTRQ